MNNNFDGIIELLQRTVPKGFYGELSFVVQDSKVVLIRENKTFKPQIPSDRKDRRTYESTQF